MKDTSLQLNIIDVNGDFLPSSRQEQAFARRNQILEVAVRLFVRKGYDGTSTKEIAREAGISEGLIFHYFPTKSELLSAVLYTQHGFLNDLKESLAKERERPAQEVLPKLARLWFIKLHKERVITLILLGTAQTNPDMGDSLKQLIQAGVDSLADYLYLCSARGELRSDVQPETGAHVFFSSIILFFIRNRDLPPDQWDQKVKPFIEDMLKVLLHGIQK